MSKKVSSASSSLPTYIVLPSGEMSKTSGSGPDVQAVDDLQRRDVHDVHAVRVAGGHVEELPVVAQPEVARAVARLDHRDLLQGLAVQHGQAVVPLAADEDPPGLQPSRRSDHAERCQGPTRAVTAERPGTRGSHEDSPSGRDSLSARGVTPTPHSAIMTPFSSGVESSSSSSYLPALRAGISIFSV